MKASLGDLPGVLKFALVGIVLLVVVGGLVAAFVFGGWIVGVVLLGGLLLVLVLLLVFLAIAAAAKKGKSKPFEQELAQNTASSAGVSDAASRARVDDLSKRFLEGIQTFKRYGKDIYDLPWFMIVGEPGSGKTEVIRHSGIGFPPGLQNELQGSGGTRNMDWWFSNNAIILDTAGRLLFEEAGSKNNDEWRALLKMLGKHRSNCPINGLMLVIPADSLIKDSGDEIEQKASRIKAQLDLIQTTLDMRFPVFILVTKADLINGFREFFDELDDPQLQHQILGWSNPGPLDAPFDPNQVFEHILTMQDRLIRRRGGLMLDPAAREGDRRIDEIDAMFSFPDAVEQIGSRLERYMQIMFSTSEWATKPLFMRGIYFVSSMQQGSALDADLAEAMGIAVDDLPEGRVWTRDRAYFIRDLFTKKMFKERGLVTRATDTKKLKRRRKAVLGVFTSIMLLVLLGVSAYSVLTLRRTMHRPSTFWTSVQEVYSKDRAVTEGRFPLAVRGTGSNLDLFGAEGGTLIAPSPVSLPDGTDPKMFEFMQRVQTQSEVDLDVPTVFLPAAWLTLDSGNVAASERREAARLVFGRSTLQPALRAAYARLDSLQAVGGGDAGVIDPAALAELVRLQRMLDVRDDWAKDAGTPNLIPVLGFAAPPTGNVSETERLEAMTALQEVFEKLLDGGKGWVASAQRTANPDYEQSLANAIGAYAGLVEQGRTGASGADDGPDPVEVLAAARAFLETERALIEAYGEPSVQDLVAWEREYADLYAKGEALDRLTSSIQGNLVQWLRAGVGGREQALREAIAPLEQVLTLDPIIPGTEQPDLSPHAAWLKRLTDAKALAMQSIIAANGVLDEQGESLRALFESRDGKPGFRARMDVYAAANALIEESWGASRFSALPGELKDLEDRFTEEMERDLALSRNASSPTPTKEAAGAARNALNLARPEKRTALFADEGASQGMPATVAEVKEEVSDHSTSYADLGIEPQWVRDLGLVSIRPGADFPDTGYHPAAARRVLDAISGVDEYGDAERGAVRARDQYAENFSRYWGDLLREGGETPVQYSSPAWRDMVETIANLPERSTAERLESLLNARVAAIDGVLDSKDITLEDDVRETLEVARERLAAQRDRVTSGTFGNDLGNWKTNWSGLGTDPNSARRTLLRLGRDDFADFYAQFCEGVSPDGGVDYFHELTLAALESLVVAVRGEAGQAMQQVNAMAGRFPLAPLPGGTPLSAPARGGVLSASDLERFVENVRVAQPTGGSGDTFAAGTLGDSGYPRVGEIDRELKALVGESSDADRARLAKLSGLAEALGRVKQAQIAVLPPRRASSGSNERLNAAGYYDLWFTASGDRRLHNIGSNDVERVDLGIVREASSGFTLRFENSTDGSSVEEQVVGPWGPIAFIHRYGGTSSDGGKTWEVEYKSSRGGATLVQWFEITLDRPLPIDTMDDWPGND